MALRQLQFDQNSLPIDLVVRCERPWTWIFFCGVLSLVHASIAVGAFLRGAWEGYMSMSFCIIFGMLATFLYCFNREVAILPLRRSIVLRKRFWRFHTERSISFSKVSGVRLTLPSRRSFGDPELVIICRDEEVICPVTVVPRQQALYMAMEMNVPLIKVLGDEPAASGVSRLDASTNHPSRPPV